MDLKTAAQFWTGLREKAGGMEGIVAFAEKAQAAGLNRGDLKWLSRLKHEPSLAELMAYTEWIQRLGREPSQAEIDAHISATVTP